MTSRLQKLNERLNGQGLRALPAWAANWAYWNARLYRVPGASGLRAQLKYRKARKKFNIDSPILVHQMGKVGSTSIYNALYALDLDVPVYHSHVLNRFDVYADGVRRTRVAPETDLAAIEEGRSLRRRIDSGAWRNWLVISLVRAPVPRSISGFFENVDAFVPDFWSRFERGEVSPAELTETFQQRYRDYSVIHWFDDQIRDVFGIDVFATPFPITQGYATYQGKNARLLLVRLEDLDHCAGSALQEFLGLDAIRLERKNTGLDKTHGVLYRAFVDQLRLSPEYIQEIHSTPYARHFYTPQELNASVARWV